MSAPETENIRTKIHNLAVMADRKPEQHTHDFDLWIIAERKRVAELATRKERNRITALLEELRSEFRARTEPDNSDVVNMCIAFIKGETLDSFGTANYTNSEETE